MESSYNEIHKTWPHESGEGGRFPSSPLGPVVSNNRGARTISFIFEAPLPVSNLFHRLNNLRDCFVVNKGTYQGFVEKSFISLLETTFCKDYKPRWSLSNLHSETSRSSDYSGSYLLLSKNRLLLHICGGVHQIQWKKTKFFMEASVVNNHNRSQKSQPMKLCAKKFAYGCSQPEFRVQIKLFCG